MMEFKHDSLIAMYLARKAQVVTSRAPQNLKVTTPLLFRATLVIVVLTELLDPKSGSKRK